jgi:hypothetical protein
MDDDGWKSVTPFVEAKKLNYTVVIGDPSLGKLYGLGAMPKTILIDRAGRIAATYDGVVDKSKCQGDIRALLRAQCPEPYDKIVHKFRSPGNWPAVRSVSSLC